MNNKKSMFDVDSLRETLGYSIQFLGKLFCIIIDAQAFEGYDYNQLVQDLLLIVESCNTKIIVFVGCFPSRFKKKKRLAMLERIRFSFESIKKQFGQYATTVKLSKEWQSLLSSQINIAFRKQSVVIAPTIQDDSREVIDVKQILASLGCIVGQDQIAKLIILSNHDGIIDQNSDFMHQIKIDQVQELINKEVVSGELAIILKTAILAVNNNIRRVHIVNGVGPGALLEELFTKDGTGTMIYSGQYIEVRSAVPEDSSGICNLLLHNYKNSIEQFLVAVIDDYVIACVKLRHFHDEKISLANSLAVNPDYPDIGIELINKAKNIAHNEGCAKMFLLIPKKIPWWIPQEFTTAEPSELPQLAHQECQGEIKSSAILVRDV